MQRILQVADSDDFDDDDDDDDDVFGANETEEELMAYNAAVAECNVPSDERK